MATSTRFAVAIHMLALIAAQKPEAVKSEALARGLNTNPAAARRLLGMLAAAGITRSRLGKHGGAVLARPAKKITLREVYRAVEAGDIVSRPRKPAIGDGNSGKLFIAAFDAVVTQSEAAFLEALGTVTLKGFLKSLRPAKAD